LSAKDDLFADIVWWEGFHFERKTRDFIEASYGCSVSPNFFSLWNIKPILGRTFTNDEAARLIEHSKLDRDTVIVLSYSLWQSQFGGDPSVLGKIIEGNDRHFTIIGVMPRHFQFPIGSRPTFWLPVERPRDSLANVRLFARLEEGVTVKGVQSMLDTVAQQLLREFPREYDNSWHKRSGGFGFLIRPLRHQFTRDAYGAEDLQRTLWALLAAIGFVLLIVCVNVANLLLARTEKRQQELAIRAALGAGRWRLLRQLLTESVLLSGLGALGGVLVAVFGMKCLIFLIPENIPRLQPIQLNAVLLVSCIVLSGLTALAFGLVPALQASRSQVSDSLKQAGTGATMSLGWRRYRGALVVIEVGLTVVLLSGAGLMIKSVVRLLHANLGFDLENVLIAHPGLLRGEKYYRSERSAKVREAPFEDMHDRMAALPGVKAVGICKLDFFQLGFTFEGREKSIGLLPAYTGVGDRDLFRAMGVSLLAGRLFEMGDIGEKAGTVIVNESMARLCWPGESALGKKFRGARGGTYEVIGITRDARIGFRGRWIDEVEPTFFRPYQGHIEGGGYGPYFVIRTERNPGGYIPAVREIIKSVENSMTTPWFEVARQTLYHSTEAPRLYMVYLLVFATVGLALSALGLYGVLSYSVARRTREIGVRIAVGAGRGDVIGMIMRGGVRLVMLGMGLGVVLALGLTRFLRHHLYEVNPADPGVFLAILLTLFAVALVACYFPARRAARIDPMVALRYE
jgi:putative ABC transport system permease protein